MPEQDVETYEQTPDRIQAHARSNAADTTDDVGHMRAVTGAGTLIERIRIREPGRQSGHASPTKS